MQAKRADSAGGLATFLHVDEYAERYGSAKVVGMPDSGFFLDYQSTKVPGLVEQASSRRGRQLTTTPGNYHAGLKWCFETFNATAGVNPACIEAHHTGGPTTDDPDWLW